MRLPSLLLAASYSLIAAVAEVCRTHEPCEVNQSCACTIPADNYNPRTFYVDFNGIEKGRNYTGTLNGLDGKFMGIQLPEGATFDCNQRDCYTFFPVNFTIDTDNMKETNGTAEVAFLAVKSDISWQLSASLEG
ncbi:MAG: hypothetical protein Q7V63_09435 [Gammaproteobacteria bacterium]|nr:hypothetical protein [Gammaproteobacteria bacterium]